MQQLKLFFNLVKTRINSKKMSVGCSYLLWTVHKNNINRIARKDWQWDIEESIIK